MIDSTGKHSLLVGRALFLLHLTYSEQHRLDRLAAQVGTSVFHLCRIFRQHTGFTIARYRNELRLKKAQAMLERGDHDILTIAVALGYSGHSHFTSVFRRRFGITPSAFREQRRLSRLTGCIKTASSVTARAIQGDAERLSPLTECGQ